MWDNRVGLHPEAVVVVAIEGGGGGRCDSPTFIIDSTIGFARYSDL